VSSCWLRAIFPSPPLSLTWVFWLYGTPFFSCFSLTPCIRTSCEGFPFILSAYSLVLVFFGPGDCPPLPKTPSGGPPSSFLSDVLAFFTSTGDFKPRVFCLPYLYRLFPIHTSPAAHLVRACPGHVSFSTFPWDPHTPALPLSSVFFFESPCRLGCLMFDPGVCHFSEDPRSPL